MGEVYQFPKGASNREALKAIVAEQDKHAYAAVQQFNSCLPMRVRRGHAEENATNRIITSGFRVLLLRKVLKIAEEQDRREARTFLGVS